MPLPRADIQIDEFLVRQLLESQHPDLARGVLTHVADGWDNSNWRLDIPTPPLQNAHPVKRSFTVRLPRRAQAADLIHSEHRWLDLVSEDLPVDVPTVERRGEPNEIYPWPWSVCRWLDGEVLGTSTLGPDDVVRLADLLAALHRPAPADAPDNPFRGVPLKTRREAFRENLGRAVGNGLLVDTRAARASDLFQSGEGTSWPSPPVWIHGDLHPRNVLVQGDRWTGLLDWGDITSGDPASDLAAARMLVSDEHRHSFWSRYRTRSGHDLPDESFESLVERADAWAVYFGVLMLEAGTPDDPTFAAVGRRVLTELLS